jgi:hypothetical protein
VHPERSRGGAILRTPIGNGASVTNENGERALTDLLEFWHRRSLLDGLVMDDPVVAERLDEGWRSALFT